MCIQASRCKGKTGNILSSWSESGKVFLESKPCAGHWKAGRVLVDLKKVGEADFPDCGHLSPLKRDAFWELVVFNRTFVKTKPSFCG